MTAITPRFFVACTTMQAGLRSFDRSTFCSRSNRINPSWPGYRRRARFACAMPAAVRAVRCRTWFCLRSSYSRMGWARFPAKPITSGSAPRRPGLRSRPPGGALSSVPCTVRCALRPRPADDHRAGAGSLHLRGHSRDQQVGDPLVEETWPTVPARQRPFQCELMARYSFHR